MYKATTKSADYTRSTTIDPSDFSGWMCRNIGSTDIAVNGYPLEPGQELDYTSIHPNVIWATPISVDIQTTGKVRFTFIRYAQK